VRTAHANRSTLPERPTDSGCRHKHAYCNPVLQRSIMHAMMLCGNTPCSHTMWLTTAHQSWQLLHDHPLSCPKTSHARHQCLCCTEPTPHR
jgi:hypothetical protein